MSTNAATLRCWSSSCSSSELVSCRQSGWGEATTTKPVVGPASRSRRRTSRPSDAAATPSPALRVLLPTPPFPGDDVDPGAGEEVDGVHRRTLSGGFVPALACRAWAGKLGGCEQAG